MTAVGDTMTGARLREFMRSWATGIAVVTSALGGEPVGCTVNSFTSVSLRPPLVLVSLAETSRTRVAVGTSGHFAVNVLSCDQDHLATHFATARGDRFAGVAHGLVEGLPVLDGALAVLACAVTETVAVADHVLVIGAPRWLTPPRAGDPAVFFGGGYRALGRTSPAWGAQAGA